MDSVAQQSLILVADDQPSIADLVAFTLRRVGHEVIVTYDSMEVLDIAHNRKPDLFILDIMMPKMTGLELTRLLRRDEQLQAVPIIMLTARAQEGDVAEGFAAGASDYIKKPFSPKELRTRVDHVLRSHVAANPITFT